MYYVIYEHYEEWSNISGIWRYGVEEFRDIYSAHLFIIDYQDHSDYRDMILTKEVEFK